MFGCSTIATCAFIPSETLEKLSELNTFQAKKKDDTYHIIDQIKVSFCKSHMLHFEITITVYFVNRTCFILKLQLQFNYLNK